MLRYGLEICVDSFESAVNAVEGGADQLEVCSSLALGGLTPTVGLVRCLRLTFPHLPLLCMIRCRDGDFLYSEDEISVMSEDLLALKSAGASGFVFGCLDESNELDVSNCARLLVPAGNLPCTLHRCFDLSADWQLTVDEAVRLGFKTILTSGQQPKAVEGVDRLAEIREYAERRIKVLVGSGVNSSTLPELLEKTGCTWFHGSASKSVQSLAPPPAFSMGSADDNNRRVTCAEETSKMRILLDEYFQNDCSL